MRVPTGNFGFQTPDRGPVVDTSPIADAAVRLGGAIVSGAIDARATAVRESQALTRLRAANVLQSRSEALKGIEDEIEADLDAGRMDTRAARAKLETKLGRLEAPDLNGSDALTREDVNHALGLQRDKALAAFDARQVERTKRRATEEGARGWEKLRTRAAAGDDPLRLERDSEIIGNLMVGSGVPVDAVRASREEFLPELWSAHADRQVLQARGNMAALEQLERDLTETDGRLVTRLKPEDTTRLLRSVIGEQDRLEAEAERAAERARRDAAANDERLQLEALLFGGMPFDPKNAQHRKYADTLFAGAAKDSGMDADMPLGGPAASDDASTFGRWSQLATDLTQRTRVMPRQVEGFLRQGARAPSGAILSAAAQMYDTIQAAAPEAIGQLDEDTKAALGMASGMLRSGASMERIVETVRQVAYDAPREVIDRRRAQLPKVAKDNAAKLSDLIDRDFDPGILAAQPAASELLRGDFDAQTARYFEKTGDAETARELAWSDLRRVYGVTRVNGDPMLVPLPVERFGVEPATVHADVADFLAANPQADGSTAADVMLVPDNLTLRSMRDAHNGAAIRPSYSLVTKSGDLVVDRHGVPKRYTVPDADQLRRLHESRQEAASAAGMAEGRAKQKAAADASRFARQAARDELRVPVQMRGR